MATIPTTDDFVTSLAVLVASDSGSEMTAETLSAIITASGNKPNASYTSLFASSVAAAGSIDKFTAAPGAAGGGGGGGGDAGGAAPAAAAEEKVEEEEMDMSGGIDMFGGEEKGGGDY